MTQASVCNRHHSVDQQVCRWLLFAYSRGRIRALDRVPIETLVCECYSVVKSEYDRLLPPLSPETGGPPPADRS
jgi:hypothetical protein